jgi:general secretion pathway protein G
MKKRVIGSGTPTAYRLPPPERGFTLLELLVVMTIIGILAAIAVPALRDSPQRAREATLREDLFTMRSVIDQYHGDKGAYPPDLQTLVSAGYLRKIPIDPMTKSADTWVVALEETSTDAAASSADTPATPGVIDVHSGSPDKALDGSTYKDW